MVLRHDVIRPIVAAALFAAGGLAVQSAAVGDAQQVMPGAVSAISISVRSRGCGRSTSALLGAELLRKS
jgi:hypothetical protein